jgi:O-methyltransferase
MSNAMSAQLFSSLKRAIVALIYDASFKTRVLDYVFFSAYEYMFSPGQLMLLAQSLSTVEDVPGCCVEVGCAYGRTTAFLRKFMDETGIVKPYYAIDTFSGFVPQHVDYEVDHRKKDKRIGQIFSMNKKQWFDHGLSLCSVTSVNSVETDATLFDYDRIGPIAFALLDVDLYVPIKDILPKLYRNLSEGGVILVDDCAPHDMWDGALAAYEEFIANSGIPREIVHGKIAVIRKPISAA